MSADPSVEENFSAIDVRCLPCGLPSPPPSPAPTSCIIPIRCTNNTSKQRCKSRHGGFLEYVRGLVWHLAGGGPVPGIQRSKLGAAWLRQAKPDLSRATFSPLCSNISNAVLTIRLLVRTIFKNGSSKTRESFDHLPFVPQRPSHFQGESIKDSWRCVFTKSCVAAF